MYNKILILKLHEKVSTLDKIQCFYAYPAADLALTETIRRSIDLINSQVPQVNVTGWQSLSVTGKNILAEVTNRINLAKLFICDLTYINSNVLFELGYAIAKRKKIWITLDTSQNFSEETYKKIKILTTTGYANYHNSLELCESFIREQPFLSLDSTIYRKTIEKILPENNQYASGIFYLKSAIATEASIELSNLIRKSSISIITDDPLEASSHPLDWYAENIYKAAGVVVHFLDDQRRVNSVQDAKYSLISGMAYGFEKKLLMLAHKPCIEPIDYRDILFAILRLKNVLTTLANGYIYSNYKPNQIFQSYQAPSQKQRLPCKKSILEKLRLKTKRKILQAILFKQTNTVRLCTPETIWRLLVEKVVERPLTCIKLLKTFKKIRETLYV